MTLKQYFGIALVVLACGYGYQKFSEAASMHEITGAFNTDSKYWINKNFDVLENAFINTSNNTVTGDITLQGDLTFSGANNGLVFDTSGSLVVAGPTDDLNLTGYNTLFMNTSTGAVTLGGIVGGVAGQVVCVYSTNTGNSATLEHAEGGGSQDILLSTSADESVTNGGWVLFCDGTSWIDISQD